MTKFLPEAWIGYGHDPKSGEFYVKVCPSCPSCGQALAEARSSQLATRMVPCSECTYKQIQARLGEPISYEK